VKKLEGGLQRHLALPFTKGISVLFLLLVDLNDVHDSGDY
jgi:hypothetical protein